MSENLPVALPEAGGDIVGFLSRYKYIIIIAVIAVIAFIAYLVYKKFFTRNNEEVYNEMNAPHPSMYTPPGMIPNGMPFNAMNHQQFVDQHQIEQINAERVADENDRVNETGEAIVVDVEESHFAPNSVNNVGINASRVSESFRRSEGGAGASNDFEVNEDDSADDNDNDDENDKVLEMSSGDNEDDESGDENEEPEAVDRPSVALLSECQIVMKTGSRRGLPCGKPLVQGSNLCAYHQKANASQ